MFAGFFGDMYIYIYIYIWEVILGEQNGDVIHQNGFLDNAETKKDPIGRPGHDPMGFSMGFFPVFFYKPSSD